MSTKDHETEPTFAPVEFFPPLSDLHEIVRDEIEGAPTGVKTPHWAVPRSDGSALLQGLYLTRIVSETIGALTDDASLEAKPCRFWGSYLDRVVIATGSTGTSKSHTVEGVRWCLASLDTSSSFVVTRFNSLIMCAVCSVAVNDGWSVTFIVDALQLPRSFDVERAEWAVRQERQRRAAERPDDGTQSADSEPAPASVPTAGPDLETALAIAEAEGELAKFRPVAEPMPNPFTPAPVERKHPKTPKSLTPSSTRRWVAECMAIALDEAMTRYLNGGPAGDVASIAAQVRLGSTSLPK